MKFVSKLLFYFALIAFAYAAGIYKLEAGITIVNDPLMPNAFQEGTIYVKYDGVSGEGSLSKSYKYINSGDHSYTELLSQAESVRYRFHEGTENSCKAESTNEPVVPLFPCDYYDAGVEHGDDCMLYTHDSTRDYEVKQLIVCNDAPAEVVFHNDKKWIFSGARYKFIEEGESTSSLFGDEIFDVSYYNCPAPECSRVVDVVLNLDASSSIDKNEWKLYLNFVEKAINSFDLGANKVNVGIVRFNQAGTVVSELTANGQSAFNHLVSWNKNGDGTCAGAGIQKAFTEIFARRSETRKALNPARVVITVTDGADSRCRGVSSTKAVMSQYGNEDVVFISFGIGNRLDANGLKLVANNNADNVLTADDFNVLEQKLSSLISTTCSALPSMTLCGPNCKGFCTHDAKCVAPKCETVPCYDVSADEENPYLGCVKTEKIWQDNKKCTKVVGCNPVNGEPVEEEREVPADIQAILDNDDMCFTLNECTEQDGFTLSPKNIADCPAVDGKIVKIDSVTGCCVYEECSKKNCMNSRIEDNTCLYEPIDPQEGNTDKCVIRTCNAGTGEIENNPVTCVVGPNKCLDYLSCDSDNGCTTVPKSYTGSETLQSGYKWYCEPSTGNWTQVCENQNACDAPNPCVRNPCEITKADICNDVVCIVDYDAADNRRCVHTSKDAEGGSCGIGGKCSGLKCNVNTGHCEFYTATFTGTKEDRQNAVCNANGEWEFVDKCEIYRTSNCDVFNYDSDTGRCELVPLDNCKVCDEGSGKPVDLVCPEKNCQTGVCNLQTGVCEYTDDDIDPRNCMIGTCNKENGDITYASDIEKCPNTACSIGSCNIDDDSCAYEPKCQSDDWCIVPVCISAGDDGCQYLTKEKEDATADELKCFRFMCNSETKSFDRVPIDAKFRDSCDFCYQKFNQFYHGEYTNTECIGSVTAKEFGLGVGALALAGIIAACAVGAAVIITTGVFGTKELLRVLHSDSASGVSTNPIYKPDGVVVDNPAFDDA